MIKVGLTGGIGSGKSFVANLFKELGVPIIMTDLIPPKFIDTDANVIFKIKEIIGEEAFDLNGHINKKIVSDKMFSDSIILKQMNDLFIPLVKEEVNKQCLELHYPYVIIESAILFESGFAADMKEIICVYADRDLRIQRVMERSALTKEEIELRMNCQMNEDDKMVLSSIAISNNNNPDLKKQIQDIHKYLLKL